MSKYVWLEDKVEAGKTYRNDNGLDYYCIDVNHFPNEAVFHCAEDRLYVIAKRPKLFNLLHDDGTVENNLLVWEAGDYYRSLEKLKEAL